MWRRRELLALATALVLPARPAPRRVLVLGGTGWIGPHVVAELVARGHRPTLFNRGVTAPGRFPELETIIGDRAGDLSEISGRSWDAAIDLSGTRPAWVRRSARALAGRVDRYLLLSSTAVYARIEGPVVDESLPLRRPPDESDPKASYPMRKAGCEVAAGEELPGRVCALRSAFVVGPGDRFERAAAWLARFARGGAVALPGRPEQVMLYVDVRDLAGFVVRALERRMLGPCNVTHRATMAAWAETCRRVSSSAASVVWAGDAPDVTAPLATRPRAPIRRYGELSAARAHAAGLELRSLRDTLEEVWRTIADDQAALASASRAWLNPR